MRKTLLTGALLVLASWSPAPAQQGGGPGAVATAASLEDRYRSFTAMMQVPVGAGAASGAAGVNGTTGAETDDTRVEGKGQRVEGTLPGDIPAEQAIGLSVYGPGGATVAAVDDVLVDGAGKVAAVILDVGGVLGLGERQVAVPTAMLQALAPGEGPTGGGGEFGGAAGITSPAGAGAGTGPTGTEGAAGGAKLALGLTEDELRGLPVYAKEGDVWVRQAAP